MSADTAIEVAAPSESPARRRDFGASARLWGGFFGRAWLWFVAGCLVVTFIPMLFGWRPYVVESGSMMPRIHVGDVLLSSPERNPQELLGRVTVFDDPAKPGVTKSHRIVRINTDGTLVSKGDANPTVDPTPVPIENVKGLGRLLVRWIGLPLIWLQKGQWVALALVVASLWLSAVLVVRDREDAGDGDDGDDGENDGDGADDGAGPDDDAGGDDDDGDGGYDPDGWGSRDRDSGDIDDRLRWKPRATRFRFLRRARHRRPMRPAEFAKALAVRTTAIVVGSTALLVPTAHAAFSATTVGNGSVWAAAAAFGPSYTADTNNLHPFLYWKLDDSTGTPGAPNTTAVDYSGNNRNGMYSPSPAGNPSWSMRQTGGLTGQSPNYSVGLAGGASDTATCVYTGAAAKTPAPDIYSEIIWFKTAPGYTGGGKLIGFESTQTGVSYNDQSQQYDRMIFMDSTGHLTFGVWTGSTTTVTSSAAYNDGAWHMAVATMGSDGMKLYVDNAQVGSNTNTTSQDYTALGGGYWRVGCGNLQGWGSDWPTQTNHGFAGNLDEATVFTTELSAQDIAKLYTDIHPAPPSLPSLVDPSFESNNLSGWTCESGHNTCARVGNPHEDGQHAASIEPYDGGRRGNRATGGELDQTLTFTPFASYTLTAWVRGANVTVGVTGGATASKTVSTGNNWQQVSVPFTVGADGSVTVYVSVPVHGDTIYVDDVALSVG